MQRERKSAERAAFDYFLRTGQRITPGALAVLEAKFNPWHDPENGRFTYGPGGPKAPGAGSRSTRTSSPVPSRAAGTPAKPAAPSTQVRRNESATPQSASRPQQAYRGMTAKGVGEIKPIAGGHFDRNGRYVPEVYPPDPYALSNPAAALSHYMVGSGEARNYYFNTIDTSDLTLSHFGEVRRILATGKPGIYNFESMVTDRDFDMGKQLSPRNLSSAATIGGLKPLATGRLIISKNGAYRFDGYIHAETDQYDFEPRKGRSKLAEFSTRVGASLPGRKYFIHVIGSKPFTRQGQLRKSP